MARFKENLVSFIPNLAVLCGFIESHRLGQ